MKKPDIKLVTEEYEIEHTDPESRHKYLSENFYCGKIYTYYGVKVTPVRSLISGGFNWMECRVIDKKLDTIFLSFYEAKQLKEHKTFNKRIQDPNVKLSLYFLGIACLSMIANFLTIIFRG